MADTPKLAPETAESAPGPAVHAVPKQVLQGHIMNPQGSACQVLPPQGLFQVLNNLTAAADVRNRGVVKRSLGAGKSLANFMLDMRGFDWSKEGANVALDEHLIPNSDAAKEYLRRARLDQKELEVCSNIMKLADSIHSPTQKSLTEKQEALCGLQQEIGEEQAISLYSRLGDLGTSLPLRWPQSWDISDRQKKAKQIFDSATDADPVVKDLKGRLHKYNNRNKFLQLSAKVAYSTLGIASFTPTLVSPIAETSLLAFMMATGGPEQDKLLHELYLCKCLESRYRCLAEETNLITECYNRAESTQNVTLMCCARELLTQISNKETTASVFEMPSDASSAACTSVGMPAEPYPTN